MDDYKKTMKIIRYYLKSSERSAIRDRNIFESFCKGDIDVETCKYRFCQSNEIPYKLKGLISNECFTDWIRSLGYRDGLQDIQK